MISQQSNYIKERKKKFLLGAMLWTALMLVVFFAGVFYLKTRNSHFTLVAALFVLPLAQNVTRFISFNRFKDPSPEAAEVIEGMKGSYHLFHSAIFTDSSATICFEHVIVTSKSIYFLTAREEVIEKYRSLIENRLEAKGISGKHIHFIHTRHTNSIKNAALKIEKDACYTSEGLEEYTKIIKNMLM